MSAAGDRAATYAPAGPINTAPASPFVPPADRRAALVDALGPIALGDHDERILSWLADWDDATVRTVVSLVRRAVAAARPVAAPVAEEAVPVRRPLADTVAIMADAEGDPAFLAALDALDGAALDVVADVVGRAHRAGYAKGYREGVEDARTVVRRLGEPVAEPAGDPMVSVAREFLSAIETSTPPPGMTESHIWHVEHVGRLTAIVRGLLAVLDSQRGPRPNVLALYDLGELARKIRETLGRYRAGQPEGTDQAEALSSYVELLLRIVETEDRARRADTGGPGADR